MRISVVALIGGILVTLLTPMAVYPQELPKHIKVERQIGLKQSIKEGRYSVKQLKSFEHKLGAAQKLDSTAIDNLEYLARTPVLKPKEFARRFPSRDALVGTLYTALVVKSLDDGLQEIEKRGGSLGEEKRYKSELQKKAVQSLGGLGLKVTTKQVMDWRRSLPVPVKEWMETAGKVAPSPKGSPPPQHGFTVNFVPGKAVGTAKSPLGTAYNRTKPSYNGNGTLNACQKPIAEDTWTTGVEDSFTWTIAGIPYPCHCGWHWPPCGTCYWDLTLTFAVEFGCEVGAKITCCGGEAWGVCAAAACVGDYCTGCTGSVTAGGGVVQTPTGSTCSYGLPLTVAASCQVLGMDAFEASYDLSPYAVDGLPCPPAGVCP